MGLLWSDPQPLPGSISLTRCSLGSFGIIPDASQLCAVCPHHTRTGLGGEQPLAMVGTHVGFDPALGNLHCLELSPTTQLGFGALSSPSPSSALSTHAPSHHRPSCSRGHHGNTQGSCHQAASSPLLWCWSREHPPADEWIRVRSMG